MTPDSQPPATPLGPPAYPFAVRAVKVGSEPEPVPALPSAASPTSASPSVIPCTATPLDSSSQFLKSLVTFPHEAELQQARARVEELGQQKLELFRANLRLAKEAVLILNAAIKEMTGSERVE